MPNVGSKNEWRSVKFYIGSKDYSQCASFEIIMLNYLNPKLPFQNRSLFFDQSSTTVSSGKTCGRPVSYRITSTLVLPYGTNKSTIPVFRTTVQRFCRFIDPAAKNIAESSSTAALCLSSDAVSFQYLPPWFLLGIFLRLLHG